MTSAENWNEKEKKMSKIMRYKNMSREHQDILDNAFQLSKGVLRKKLKLELMRKTGFTECQIERYFTEKRRRVTKGSILTQDNILDFLICTEGDEEQMPLEERVEKAKEYGVQARKVHELSARACNPEFQRKGNGDKSKIRGEVRDKLMAAFHINPYCKGQRLTKLAHSTGLKKKTITTWFQTQRSKLGMTDKNLVCGLHSQAVRMMKEYFELHGTTPKRQALKRMERETNQSKQQIQNWFRREKKKVKKVKVKGEKYDMDD